MKKNKSKIIFLILIILIMVLLTFFIVFNSYTKNYFALIYIDKALYFQQIKIKYDLINYYKEYIGVLKINRENIIKPLIFIFSENYQKELNKNYKEILHIIQSNREDNDSFSTGQISYEFFEGRNAFSLVDSPIIFIKLSKDMKISFYTEISHRYLFDNVSSNIYNLHFFAETLNNFLNDYLTNDEFYNDFNNTIVSKYQELNEGQKTLFLQKYLKIMYPDIKIYKEELSNNFNDFLNSIKKINQNNYLFVGTEKTYYNKVLLLNTFFDFVILKYGNEKFLEFIRYIYANKNYIEDSYCNFFDNTLQNDLNDYYNALWNCIYE